MLDFRIPILMAAAFFTAPVMAQSGPAKANSAVKAVHTVNDGAARRGANSFTQAQARDHIARSGYTHVSPLVKDADGVWRGTAQKAGHSVKVGMDFKGNVVAPE